MNQSEDGAFLLSFATKILAQPERERSRFAEAEYEKLTDDQKALLLKCANLIYPPEQVEQAMNTYHASKTKPS
jgi:hypothetical protein